MQSRRQTSQRTQDSRNDMAVSFLGFVFCLIYHRLGTKEAGNPENTNEHRQKYVLFRQRTRKWTVKQERKLLDNARFTLAKHYRKKLWPHPQPYQQRSSCNVILPPLPGYYEAPQLPCWVVSEANREKGHSSLPGRNRHRVSELPGNEETLFSLSTGEVSEKT